MFENARARQPTGFVVQLLYPIRWMKLVFVRWMQMGFPKFFGIIIRFAPVVESFRASVRLFDAPPLWWCIIAPDALYDLPSIVLTS